MHLFALFLHPQIVFLGSTMKHSLLINHTKIHFDLVACRYSVTSYLAADVFLRCDDLVHVGSQSGVQWNSLSLTGFDQCLILTCGLGQHLPVHRIRDLEERRRRRSCSSVDSHLRLYGMFVAYCTV